MEIKGLSILEYYLTKSLHDWGFTDLKAQAAADFMYDNDTKTIYFPLVMAIDHNEEFQKWAEANCGWQYATADPFILSFFHEVGHYVTWPLWGEEAWDSYYEAKDYINNYGLAVEDYFELPQEETATQYAVNFVHGHMYDCIEWWYWVKKILRHIYKINNIEAEVVE